MTSGAQPILVTGLPRSGTTWLARQLARAPRTALPGREPMNPRAKQFALGGTLSTWTRLDSDTMDVAQRRTLQRVYQGREPRVYSRYGVRQWRAALPATRLLVKDPFALLSLPVVMELTNAFPVVLFRHPGALLASYRRMGWTPAVHEVEKLLGQDRPRLFEPDAAGNPQASTASVAAMSWFWASCYNAALDDVAGSSSALFVDHAELTLGGEAALRELMARCGLDAGRLQSENHHAGSLHLLRRNTATPALHNFHRTAEDVVDGWRATMTAADASSVDEQTRDTWARLRDRRFRLAFEENRSDSSTLGGERR